MYSLDAILNELRKCKIDFVKYIRSKNETTFQTFFQECEASSRHAQFGCVWRHGLILMSTLNIQLLCRKSIDFPELAIFASRAGAMINLHWLISMARTIFHGPKMFELLKFDCIQVLNWDIQMQGNE